MVYWNKGPVQGGTKCKPNSGKAHDQGLLQCVRITTKLQCGCEKTMKCELTIFVKPAQGQWISQICNACI